MHNGFSRKCLNIINIGFKKIEKLNQGMAMMVPPRFFVFLSHLRLTHKGYPGNEHWKLETGTTTRTKNKLPTGPPGALIYALHGEVEKHCHYVITMEYLYHRQHIDKIYR